MWLLTMRGDSHGASALIIIYVATVSIRSKAKRCVCSLPRAVSAR